MERGTVTVIRDDSGTPTGLEIPSFRLSVLRGPDVGRCVVSSDRRATIGRQPPSDLILTDGGVSAIHCELVVDELGVLVSDLGSKNGVFTGERRVRSIYLRHRDLLTVGATDVQLELTGALARRATSERRSLGRLVGGSVPMRELYRQLELAASSDAPVLLTGESGVGKELAAEQLIALGPRRDGPVVVVDCHRGGSELFEAELFGHEQGAFTGAQRSVPGAFERAHRGTLVLDGVAELPVELQAKLLRALASGQTQRLGAAAPVAVDVRVVALTQREPEREVNRGTFRSDLFYRLAGLQLRVPSLRERSEDIPLLVARFLEELGPVPPLPPRTLQQLYLGDYPGNVRELRHAVERAVLGIPSPVAPLPAGVAVDWSQPYRAQKERLLASFERAYFTGLSAASQGSVTEAARRSGLSRMQLYTLLRRHGLKD